MASWSQSIAFLLAFSTVPIGVARAQTEGTTASQVAPSTQDTPHQSSTPALAALAVRISLSNTTLTETAVRAALKEEFGVPVVRAEGEDGLRVVVDGQTLHASYRDGKGQLIERTLELPRDPASQAETIALLSGNLARDEAGQLLSEVRASEAELQAASAEKTPEESQEGREETPPSETSEPALGTQNPPKGEEKGKDTPPDAPSQEEPPKSDNVPLAQVSFSFAGESSYPQHLSRKRTNFHLGLLYSDIGSLDGFAANVIALRNRGIGAHKAGQGAQVATIWIRSDGFFRGFSGAAIATQQSGGIEGAQAAGIGAFQKNETEGALLAGVASVAMSHVQGAQLAGVVAATWGNVLGVHGAGAAALLHGDLEGVQGATALALTTGKVDGFQLGAATFTSNLEGAQIGFANIAHGGLEGAQIGLANYAGDFRGAQIGLINIGGHVEGTQIGLLNIAKDIEGIALAPINIIPGIRNQIVSYGSWSPANAHAGTAAGPLLHVGAKFLMDAFYTQLTFGIGAEAEECPDGVLPGDASCTGNGVLYAQGFAVGLRGKIAAGLFSEFDLQYQFEQAFTSSSASRHAVLGRAALGYEFGKNFAVYAGGGPRMDILVDPEGTVSSLATWDPHVFAGIQVF